MSLTAQFGFDSSHCFIGGAWQPSASGEVLELINPSNNEVLCSIARGTAADIDAAVQAAQTAMQTGWGRSTALERGRVLTHAIVSFMLVPPIRFMVKLCRISRAIPHIP